MATGWRAWWLILVACSAVSVVMSAMAALNTALPEIATDLSADSGQMTWIIDGYTLALAALLLPAGAIGDRYGRRGVLILGLVIFGLASLAGVWVNTPTELIISRVIAGVGAALIMPATLSLITSSLPENRRALGVSMWAAITGAGAILGFLVTGVLLEFFSWHSVFIVFAASTVAIIVISFTIKSTKDAHPGRFDFIGSITSVLAVTGVVFGLLEVPARGWDDPLVLTAIIGGLVLAVGFVVVELRLAEPLLDVRLFTNRAFGTGSLSVALQFLASFGIFFVILQRLQLVFGWSALMSAVGLLPMIAGVMVFALIGNWLAVRFHSYRYVVGGGVMLIGVGLLVLGLVPYEQYWQLAIMLAVAAIGIGLATAPSTTAIMSNTPLDNQGVGSAVNDTARELGAAIGIALVGSVVAIGYSNRIGPTADTARDAINQAGEQLAAAGDTAGAAEIAAQADEASYRIGQSLAEAIAVGENLAPQDPGLAETIISGARDAFIEPMNLSCTILGGILLVGGAVIGWLAPREVAQTPPAA